MFNDVHFTGTVNLGNIANAVVFLIGSIALYFRIKAKLADHEKETGQKIETSILNRLKPPGRKISPATKEPDDKPNNQQEQDDSKS